MDIDPRLRETSNEEPKAYGHHSAQPALYTLNPIQLPSSQPHSTGLPSLRQEIGHPHYTVQQESRPQIEPPSLPASQPHDHAPSLQPVPELKRSRACEACRGLKVRCVPDQDGKCKRCAKAGRQCIVTASSRKRQKKSDSRVVELEKKIDALTASLQATRTQQINGTNSETSEDDNNGEILACSRPDLQSRQSHVHRDALSWQGPDTAITQKLSRKRRRSPHHDNQDTVDSSADTNASSLQNGNATKASITLQGTVCGEWSPPNTYAAGPSADDFQNGQGNIDVIDKRLLDAETAARIFHHYMENMSHHMPAVVFPPNTDPSVVRRQKPTLFLAILSVAAGDYPDLQKILLKELTRRYADCLICKNHKSLDIIQALQISTIWYAPEVFRDAKQYQLILMATTQAIGMGLGQRGRPLGPFSLGWKEMRHASKDSTDEAGMAERRRAWVSCYVLCGHTAMSLRLPNLLRWNSYLEECIQGFESSPDALPSDKFLGRWAKLQRLKDDIVIQYELDDAFTPTGPTSLKAEKSLSALKEQLDQWEKESHNSSASLALAFHACRMHMFHIRVRLSYCPDAVGEPHPLSDDHKAVKSWDVPAPSEVDTVRNFIRSIHKVFEDFLSFTVVEVRTIPTFHFIRIAYAVVCLLRLNRGAKKPDSELGKMIHADTLEVDSYIARLLKLMQSAAADGKSRPAQTFQLALTTIKTWFKRDTDTGFPYGEGNVASHAIKLQPVDSKTDSSYKESNIPKNESPNPSSSDLRPQHREHQQHEPTQQYHPPIPPMNNSPLHPLSQVATGNSPGPAQHLVSNPGNEGWYNGSYPSYSAPDPNVMQTPYPINPAYYPIHMNYLDANFSSNDSTMYPGVNTDIGFQQALGLQYGQEMDLCAMFMDDNFLPPTGTGSFKGWDETM